MKSKLLNGLMFGMILSVSGAASGQCISTNMAQNLGNSVSGHTNCGQGFTADCDGFIVEISVEYNAPPTPSDKTLNIRDGGLPTSPIIHTQTIPGVSMVPGVNTFIISSPVPINLGEQNSFELVEPTGISWNSPGAYAGGDAWFSGSVLAGFDITFEVIIDAALNLGPDSTICPGDSLLLDASASFVSYLWNTGETSSSIYADTAGLYIVQAFDGTDTLTDSVLISHYVVDPVDLGEDRNLCPMDTVCFDAGAGASYLWNNGETTDVICTDSSDTYIVEVTDANGCKSTDTVLVVDLAYPVADIGSVDSSNCEVVSFTDGSSDATSWDWDFGDTGSSTDQNPTYSYTAPGTFTVILTASNECGMDTAMLILNIDCFTGIGENFANNLKVYPNPANDRFFVELESMKDEKIQILLSDVAGKKVYENTITSDKDVYVFEYACGDLEKGTYYLRVESESGARIVQLVIQ